MSHKAPMQGNGFAIPFTKAHAQGNDFIVIDGSVLPHGQEGVLFCQSLWADICDRRRGVGADNVEVVLQGWSSGDPEVLLFNPDGSTGNAR